RLPNSGGAWQALGTAPAANPNGQGGTHLALLADRTNPTGVWVSGDAEGPSASGGVYSWNNTSGTWDAIFGDGANGTSPHSDSRSMTWDDNGNLIQTNDGGIYRLTGIGTSQVRWQPLMGDFIDVHETYSAAYIPGYGLIYGTQDTGTPETSPPDGTNSGFHYQDATSGDG